MSELMPGKHKGAGGYIYEVGGNMDTPTIKVIRPDGTSVILEPYKLKDGSRNKVAYDAILKEISSSIADGADPDPASVVKFKTKPEDVVVGDASDVVQFKTKPEDVVAGEASDSIQFKTKPEDINSGKTRETIELWKTRDSGDQDLEYASDYARATSPYRGANKRMASAMSRFRQMIDKANSYDDELVGKDAPPGQESWADTFRRRMKELDTSKLDSPEFQKVIDEIINSENGND